MNTTDTPAAFDSLGLPQPLLQAVQQVGYETPSPIQARSIPVLLEGRDLLGQAQTGTGKTAAFALPLLARIDSAGTHTQVLVLTPTRELAIQVAEAFQTYARFLKGFHVLPIYGGQAYTGQFRQLKSGAQVVVGTPGRVMDHIRKGTLKLDRLSALVLDEADEMLRMGFIDDVEWILQHTPPRRQIALFSATMPKVIRQVADRHLNDPVTIKVETTTTTAPMIRQRYWPVAGLHKLDALTRILEAEPFDAALIFVRTKTATVELAEKLAARGYRCEALNGDIAQAQREQTVDKLRKGRIDLLVATDVVARGLDVQRISHVINYDIPHDTESYVHRIGRTGRAGRSGEAILFVARREQRMLKAIEHATGQRIEMMALPTVQEVNRQRLERFKQRIVDTLEREELSAFEQLVREYLAETDTDPVRLAAALACMAQGEAPMLLQDRGRDQHKAGKDSVQAAGAPARKKKDRRDAEQRPRPGGDIADVAMECYRLEVGARHGVKPGNIVGAIANEAGIESRYIANIDIHDEYSTVELPAGMPREIFEALKNAWVCQRKLAISRLSEGAAPVRKRKKAVKRDRPAAAKTGKKKAVKKKA